MSSAGTGKKQGSKEVISWAFGVHVSENPTVGVDQMPAADLWRHVQNVFQALYKDADVQVEGKGRFGRDSQAIRNRFQHPHPEGSSALEFIL
jgi:hypothetical protein